MRIYIYEENTKLLDELSRCKLETTPTKFINDMIVMLQTDCHNGLAEEIYETVKRVRMGRTRRTEN